MDRAKHYPYYSNAIKFTLIASINDAASVYLAEGNRE